VSPVNLLSGKIYWPTTLVNPPSYPSLEEDIKCDVLIIGGGSSGAMCANYLSDIGLKVVVVDKGKISNGSTSVNTALIQYLGDKMLHELVNSFGEEKAILHTKLCEQSIKDIEKTSSTIDYDCEFKLRDTLYYASDVEGESNIKKDFSYLKSHNFKAELLNKDQIYEKYNFKKDLALYLYDDAEINPFKYTHRLFEKASKKGVRIFEHTSVNGKLVKKDSTTIYTKNGHSINTRFVIAAAGYEILEIKVEKNCVLSSSYTVVTNPVDDFKNWYKRTLIWETARPYIYMRTTSDNRIIIGGLDENTTNEEERDSKIISKKEFLINEFNKLFPNIKVQPEFYVAAFFGGTHDGLPMLKQYDKFPNWYFLFSYGDNGLVYSNLLAKILRDVISNKSNDAYSLYNRT
jgi:glycine/D-amino acid oxidase-like deaminating enzyme